MPAPVINVGDLNREKDGEKLKLNILLLIPGGLVILALVKEIPNWPLISFCPVVNCASAKKAEHTNVVRSRKFFISIIWLDRNLNNYNAKKIFKPVNLFSNILVYKSKVKS